MRYAFSGLVVDTERCEVLHGTASLTIRPKAFDLLCHLIRRAGRLSTKDEILAAVWPDVEVTDDSLTQCVAELRRTLGQVAASPIRTVPRRGYMLDCEVTELGTAIAHDANSPRWSMLVMGSVFTAAVVFATYAASQRSIPTPLPSDVLTHTVLGQDVQYPAGPVRIVAGTKTLPVGFTSDVHTHDAPLIAYVLRGRVEVDYGTRGTLIYGPGETFIEAMGWPHSARSVGWRRAEVLVFELTKP